MSKKNEALDKSIYTLEYIAQQNPQFRDMAYDTIHKCKDALENYTEVDAKSFQMGFDCSVDITDEEIHNIWLHMQGKSEGLIEAGSKCDFPVMYSRALIEFMKGKLV